MPVLLSNPDDFETWLSAPPEEAFKLARSYAAEQMRIVQSGSEREDLLGPEQCYRPTSCRHITEHLFVIDRSTT